MTAEAQQAYDEALKRIEECHRRGNLGVSLDLGALGLTMLPPEIGHLTELLRLAPSSNEISSHSQEIGQHKALIELNLDFNRISMLPPEIGQLTALTKLSIFANQYGVWRSQPGRTLRLQRRQGLQTEDAGEGRALSGGTNQAGESEAVRPGGSERAHPEDAESACELLAEHQWLIVTVQATRSHGSRPTTTYNFNPQARNAVFTTR